MKDDIAKVREGLNYAKNYLGQLHARVIDRSLTAIDAIETRLNGQNTGEWQMIETAPKDGTWILAYWPTMPIEQYPATIFADDHSEHDIWYMPNNLDFGPVYPTHWMPLPSSPPPAHETRLKAPHAPLNRTAA